VDGHKFADVKAHGVDRWFKELASAFVGNLKIVGICDGAKVGASQAYEGELRDVRYDWTRVVQTLS